VSPIRRRYQRRKAIGPLALVLGSALAFLVMFELLLRGSVPYLPLRYHKYLPGEMFMLAQHSKRALIPHDYVAIFGDSYAQGAGDWYEDAVRQDWGEGLAYQAAHVMFQATGRDVISFGASGAGSFDGLVYFPLRLRAKLAARGIDLQAPRQIVAYFFEGNDLNNNLNLLKRHWQRVSGRPEVTSEPDEMVEFLRALLDRYRGWLDDPLRLSDRLYLAKFATVLYGDLRRVAKPWLDPDKAKPLPPTAIRLGGASRDLPNPLHAPALDLSEQERRQALLVFHAALTLAKETFAPIPILLVYVPSPLVVYELAAERVPVDAYEGPHQVHASAEVDRQSERICARVADIAAAVGVDFLDPRPALRAVARDRLIHGPGDWKHFNRAGYEALGRAITQALEGNRTAGHCEALTAGR
jgi:nucleotide-binding universal stress UspA family protein